MFGAGNSAGRPEKLDVGHSLSWKLKLAGKSNAYFTACRRTKQGALFDFEQKFALANTAGPPSSHGELIYHVYFQQLKSVRLLGIKSAMTTHGCLSTREYD